MEQDSSEEELIKVPNNSKTRKQYQFFAYGQYKQPKGAGIKKYFRCSAFSSHDCEAKITQNFSVDGEPSPASYVGFHNHEPVKEESGIDRYARTHSFNLTPKKLYNQSILDGSPKPKKHFENKLGYQRSKAKAKALEEAFEDNDMVAVVMVKPLVVVTVNTLIDETWTQVKADTTYGLVEDGLKLTTLLAVHLGQAIPLAHMIGHDVKETAADFGTGLQKSLKKNWPNAIHLGDKFHLFQAVGRWTASNTPGIDNGNIMRELGKLVDSVDWVEFDKNLERFYELFAEFKTFIKYFKGEWINRYPPQMWCSANGHENTSSIIENYHNELQTDILPKGSKQPTEQVVPLILHSYNLISAKMTDPKLLKLQLKSSKSKIAGLVRKTPKSKKPQLLIDGREKDEPKWFAIIDFFVQNQKDVRVVYPGEGRNFNERYLSEVKWENWPYSFKAWEAGYDKEKKHYNLKRISRINPIDARKAEETFVRSVEEDNQIIKKLKKEKVEEKDRIIAEQQQELDILKHQRNTQFQVIQPEVKVPSEFDKELAIFKKWKRSQIDFTVQENMDMLKIEGNTEHRLAYSEQGLFMNPNKNLSVPDTSIVSDTDSDSELVSGEQIVPRPPVIEGLYNPNIIEEEIHEESNEEIKQDFNQQLINEEINQETSEEIDAEIQQFENKKLKRKRKDELEINNWRMNVSSKKRKVSPKKKDD